jgi:hypothetical protein
MSSFLRRVRTLLHGSDARRSAEEEASAARAHARRASALADQVERAYRAKGKQAVTIGSAAEGGWPVGLPASEFAGHTALWGPSGAGKSYLLTLILLALLRAGVRRFVIADPKQETVALAKRALATIVQELPPREAEEFERRIVSIDLFSSERLPKLQILAPEAGVDPELLAFEISTLITAEMDMAAGLRQEAVLHRVLECMIRAGLPLTVLPRVLLGPELLLRLASTHEPRELFLATAERIAKEPKERILGLVARAERLLRLKSTRLVLGGSDRSIDFDGLLDRMTLIDLAPPAGSADVGRLLSALVWMKLAHAIRRRANGAPRVHVIVDEWPTFLAGGGARLADSFEELLRLARSKGVFLTVLSQDMASVAKISASLPDIVRTNMHLHCIFRAIDADAWDFALPVTGCRPRSPASGIDAGKKCLDRRAELALLREELARLPDRECYFVDRRKGLPGVRMRTADLKLAATDEDVQALTERASRSDAVASVTELEQGERAVQERVNALLGSDQPQPDPGSPTPRRTRRRRSELG